MTELSLCPNCIKKVNRAEGGWIETYEVICKKHEPLVYPTSEATMSDALTDLARDERRASAVNWYCIKLLEWLKAKALPEAKEAYDAVAKAAEDADSIHGGYWGSGSTHLSKDLESRLRLLAANDEREWIKLVASPDPDCCGPFMDVSPFKGMTLMFYRHGRVDGVVRGGRECRIFDWVWNDPKYQIGDNGRWEAKN